LLNGTFVDLGSKYHKIARMYQGLFYAIRANIEVYDAYYLQKYPAEKYTNVVLTTRPVTAFTRLPSNNILIVDAIYYVGILENLMTNIHMYDKVYVVMNVYKWCEA
jgi:uncharacterized protein (DUF2225 family)